MPDPLFALLLMVLFLAVVLVVFWPEKGLVSRWRQAREANERVLLEDALKHLHMAELSQQQPSLQSIAGTLHITTDRAASLLEELAEHKLVRFENGEFPLTPDGQAYALNIIRAHRLWERHLADETGFAESEWHDRAERTEHTLSVQEIDALSMQLGNPSHDPHGDPIPTAEGELVAHSGKPLTALPLGQPLRIVHLEDEPETIYAQLIAEELYPGMRLLVLESTRSRVRFWADGDEHVLAPIAAANISATPIKTPQPAAELSGDRLDSLKPGEQAKVVGLSPRSRGPERRRMLDLGILSGTLIAAEFASPGGDPIAYRIRGALIALRKEQAQLIHITDRQEVPA